MYSKLLFSATRFFLHSRVNGLQKKLLFGHLGKTQALPLPTMRYVLIAAALYILYKLVFDLIVPVSRATSQVRAQMRQMQEMQQQQFQQQQTQAQARPAAAQQRPEPSGGKPSKDDYLDFEEIK